MKRVLFRPRVLVVLGALLSIGGSQALKHSGPSYPKAWDPQILKLASATEKLRGLNFKRPVYVRFLTDAEFDRNDSPDTPQSATPWAAAYVSDSDAVLHCFRSVEAENHPPCAWNDGASGDDVDPIASVFHAIGLAKPGDDASELPLSIEGAFAIARYDDVHKVIEVRGRSAAGNEPTIVHELVHVLHDQNFKSKWPENTDEILAFRALSEGDARRIENDFIDSEDLSAAERAVRKKVESETERAAEKRIDSAVDSSKLDNAIVGLRVRRSSFPYDEGEYFVRKLIEKLGREKLDAAFLKPPRSTAEILNPPLFFNYTLKNPVVPDLLNVQNAYSTKPFRLGAWYGAEALWAAGLNDEAIHNVIKSWAGDAMVIYEDQSKHRVCFSTAIALQGSERAKASAALNTLALRIKGTFEPTSTGGTLSACDLSRKLES